MGGEWADALGEKYDDRTAGIEARCDDVLRAMDTTPEESYRLLRSIDSTFVSRIATTVEDVARRDPADAPYASELGLLLERIANASRETMHARRAADLVKEDAEQKPAPASYATDKNTAEPIVREGSAMGLLYADHGPYASEAHTIGLLIAMDRMEIGRGLPKHLKIDAVRDAYSLVFGVSAPLIAGQGADRAPAGAWLGYVSQVAKAAHHEVPADVKALPDRETLAWTGVLEGFADKLRSEPAYAAPQTPLGQMLRGVVARLDDEYETARKLQQARSQQRTG